MKTCLTSEEIKSKLKEAGVSPTAQRIAICKYVLCEADHPSADEVKAWADENFPMVSRATVYNTLNTLVDVGMLKEVRVSHSNKVVFDDNTSHHYHFYDEESGKLFDVAPESVEIKLNLPKTMIADEIEVVLKGKLKG